MQLSDYFFVKCFPKQSFRNMFNRGELFFRNAKKYWNENNSFQQDFECRIVQQEGNGAFIKIKPGYEDIIKQAHSMKEIEELVNENKISILARTTSFSARIDACLCCFYLLPKKDVVFRGNKLYFTNDAALKHFVKFLSNYLKDSSAAYVGIYDAARLCVEFDEACNNQGIKFGRNYVSYANIDEKHIFSYYNQGNIERIVFTKPKSYEYQREYRFLVSPLFNKKINDVEENADFVLHGVNVPKCIVTMFDCSSN